MDTSPGMYYYNKDSMFNINDLLRCPSRTPDADLCLKRFYSINSWFILIVIIFISLCFVYVKKKRAVILSLVIWWKLKFGSLKNIGGIYWGCRVNDYLQFSSWIFHTLNFTSISYDSSSQGGYSSLM